MLSNLSFLIPYTFIGPGAINNLPEMARGLGGTKILITTDTGVIQAGLLDKVKQPLEKAKCKFDVFDRCLPNAPIKIIEECARIVTEGKYNLLIAVGGGSVMDMTKVVSIIAPNGLKTLDLRPPNKPVIKKVLPKILVPTTAGTGSEWSFGANVTDEAEGVKKPIFGKHFWANGAIIDPEMTLNLPQNVTAETGFDVLAHAIEAYTTSSGNMFGDMLAEFAIKLVAENLRQAYAMGRLNIEARYNMAVASAVAMKSNEINGGGLGHFLDSFVVSKVHISHGAALAITLPPVMEYNLMAAPKKFARIAEMMGEETFGLSEMDAAKKSVDAVKRLLDDMGLKQKLSEVGMSEADFPWLVSELFRLKAHAVESQCVRRVTPQDVMGILKAAL